MTVAGHLLFEGRIGSAQVVVLLDGWIVASPTSASPSVALPVSLVLPGVVWHCVSAIPRLTHAWVLRSLRNAKTLALAYRVVHTLSMAASPLPTPLLRRPLAHSVSSSASPVAAWILNIPVTQAGSGSLRHVVIQTASLVHAVSLKSASVLPQGSVRRMPPWLCLFYSINGSFGMD
jgi:hypothetical protein